MIEYFDSHAHMDDRAFRDDQAELLTRLPQQGVRYIMNPGCNLSSSQAACALADAYEGVYAAVGSHPDDAA